MTLLARFQQTHTSESLSLRLFVVFALLVQTMASTSVSAAHHAHLNLDDYLCVSNGPISPEVQAATIDLMGALGALTEPEDGSDGATKTHCGHCLFADTFATDGYIGQALPWVSLAETPALQAAGVGQTKPQGAPVGLRAPPQTV